MSVPALPESVPAVVRAFSQHHVADCACRFECELMLREMLSNAVTHGRRAGATTVEARVRTARSGMLLYIGDNGPGFDWHTALDRSSDPRLPSGRGIEIVRRLASRIRFNRRGNHVVILCPRKDS